MARAKVVKGDGQVLPSSTWHGQLLLWFGGQEWIVSFSEKAASCPQRCRYCGKRKTSAQVQSTVLKITQIADRRTGHLLSGERFEKRATRVRQAMKEGVPFCLKHTGAYSSDQSTGMLHLAEPI